MSDSFLRLVKVTKQFGDRLILDRLSLEVAKGEIVALLGPSGCGKTTTLRIIAGLETPDRGEVWIGEHRVAADRHNLLQPSKRRIGMVFQDLALWPHMTVAGNLDFVLASAKVPLSERGRRIVETLQLVRIESFAASYPQHLSGGEQQRVAIARALVGKPDLLLLDEPLSSLDTNSKTDLLNQIAGLQQALEVTTVFITHDRGDATKLAHRIIEIGNRQIEQQVDSE